MKLNRKNVGTFVLLLLLGAVAGSLAWELLERLARLAGLGLSLTLQEPIQLFDLYVLALSVRANPGTFLGGAAAAIFFGRL